MKKIDQGKNMDEETYELIEDFDTGELHKIPLPQETGIHDCGEIRKFQGFEERMIFHEYFHNLSEVSLPFSEMFFYKKADLSILELWDSSGLLIQLATRKHSSALKIIEMMTNIAKNMSTTEKNIVDCLKAVNHEET
jgi:hypothetical protein